ncbi:MAG: leucyl aminopeptidase family protein [Bacteroidales bacterium]|nr:leucyl aminopeptidase family protein [Bacteroidales bacterium]
MTYNLETLPKDLEANVLFLYGDEVSDRSLPLSRRELALVKERRADKRDFLLVFDRLPYRFYLLSFDSEKPTPESQEGLRRSAMKVLKRLEEDKVADLTVTGEGILDDEMAAVVEGLTLADYSFDRYRNKEAYHLATLTIDDRFMQPAALEASKRLWNRIFWCREWVNLPVQDLNAAAFADELQSIASDMEEVKCTVMDKKQIESLRMGGLLGVNRGSVDDPRFVVLEYKPRNLKNQNDPICLVGKGIMYDTGGLNIKPGDYMQEMKSDMAGAATMASVLFAAADNHLPVHIVALLPMTDNRPGFNAYAADDILTMYDGTTVEVINTDAEGRLILADAIAYAAKNYHPRLIIDAATLTGAAVRAISTFGIAAMQQHAADPFNLLKIVGDQVFERLVEFPMWSEYDEYIKSDVADLRNSSTTPQAGTITAGKFLAHFAGEVPYIHLDIAGVAYFTKPQHCYRMGASAYGTRLLYAFLQMQDMIEK